MSNTARSHQDQDRIKGLATTWWQLELKIAREMLAHDQHEKKISELRELQQKVTLGLADFQVVRGAFAVPIAHGVLVVRNAHDSNRLRGGRQVDWYPDQTTACLPDRVVNSEVPDLDQAAAALAELDQPGS